MFTLEVSLVRAQDLPASDFGFMGMGGKSDPYFTFKVGRTVQKSSVIKKELSPVWTPNETFTFQVPRPKESVLEIQAYDHDHGNQDDLLGSVTIALAPFVEKNGASEVLSYELDVPANFNGHTKRSFVFLEVKCVSSDRADRLLELWENQRYHVVKKWTTDAVMGSDRKRWSSISDATVSSDSFEDVAPAVPEGMTADGWTLDVAQGDDNGWIYAPSFQGPWEKKAFTLAMVRRRKWINKCRIETNQGGPVAY